MTDDLYGAMTGPAPAMVPDHDLDHLHELLIAVSLFDYFESGPLPNPRTPNERGSSAA